MFLKDNVFLILKKVSITETERDSLNRENAGA